MVKTSNESSLVSRLSVRSISRLAMNICDNLIWQYKKQTERYPKYSSNTFDSKEGIMYTITLLETGEWPIRVEISSRIPYESLDGSVNGAQGYYELVKAELEGILEEPEVKMQTRDNKPFTVLRLKFTEGELNEIDMEAAKKASQNGKWPGEYMKEGTVALFEERIKQNCDALIEADRGILQEYGIRVVKEHKRATHSLAHK